MKRSILKIKSDPHCPTPPTNPPTHFLRPSYALKSSDQSYKYITIIPEKVGTAASTSPKKQQFQFLKIILQKTARQISGAGHVTPDCRYPRAVLLQWQVQSLEWSSGQSSGENLIPRHTYSGYLIVNKSSFQMVKTCLIVKWFEYQAIIWILDSLSGVQMVGLIT